MRSFADNAATKNSGRFVAISFTLSSHSEGPTKEFFVSTSEVLLEFLLHPCECTVRVSHDLLRIDLALIWQPSIADFITISAGFSTVLVDCEVKLSAICLSHDGAFDGSLQYGGLALFLEERERVSSAASVLERADAILVMFELSRHKFSTMTMTVIIVIVIVLMRGITVFGRGWASMSRRRAVVVRMRMALVRITRAVSWIRATVIGRQALRSRVARVAV